MHFPQVFSSSVHMCILYQTTLEFRVNISAFAWACCLVCFLNVLSVWEVLRTDPLRLYVDSAVEEAGYWDFTTVLLTWGNCLWRIITQTFLQTNGRDLCYKHSVLMSVTDAFWVWIPKELMSQKVSDRYDITASINNALHNVLQATGVNHLHCATVPVFEIMAFIEVRNHIEQHKHKWRSHVHCVCMLDDSGPGLYGFSSGWNWFLSQFS